MVCVAWVFFRAESVGEAVGYLFQIDGNFPKALSEHKFDKYTLLRLASFVFLEIMFTKPLNDSKTHRMFSANEVNRILFFGLMALIILSNFMQNSAQEFIYFAF